MVESRKVNHDKNMTRREQIQAILAREQWDLRNHIIDKLK